MLSRLEELLWSNDGFKNIIFSYLQQHGCLTSLRCGSRTLKTLIQTKSNLIFRTIYAHAPLREESSVHALQRIATHCNTLTIKVKSGEQGSPYAAGEVVSAELQRQQKETARKGGHGQHVPSNSVAKALWRARYRFHGGKPSQAYANLTSSYNHGEEMQNVDQVLWKTIFRCLPNLITLNIRVNGDPGWPGFTEVEDTLITLRLALESEIPRRLRSVSLDPIHASGILHLRWSGFGPFAHVPFRPRHDVSGVAAPLHTARVWTDLVTLDLRVRHPAVTGRVGDKQMLLFYKIFDDYLRSFSKSLKCLRLVWLDAAGPSPLMLHELVDAREPIHWSRLVELWVGNVTDVEQTLALISERAPGVTKVKTLRYPLPGLMAVGLLGKDAWVDVLNGRHNALSQRHPLFDRSSMATVDNTPSLTMTRPEPATTRRRTAVAIRSSICSHSIYSENEQTSTGNPDIIEQLEEAIQIISSIPAAASASNIRHPTDRAIVRSSVYSQDEDGNFVPARHNWKTPMHVLPGRQISPAQSVGISPPKPLFPQRIPPTQHPNPTSQPASSTPSPIAEHIPPPPTSPNEPNPAPPHPASSSIYSQSIDDNPSSPLRSPHETPINPPRSKPSPLEPPSAAGSKPPHGRRPPPIAPSSATLRDYIDLRFHPAYVAERNAALAAESFRPDPGTPVRHGASLTMSWKDRVWSWRRAVPMGERSMGGDGEEVERESLFSVKTDVSGPFSKFMAGLREGGKPPKVKGLGREKEDLER